MTDPLWTVQEVPGPAPWMSQARLAEQERRLTPQLFRRLFHNEWVSLEDRLGTEEDLAACVTLDGPQPPQRGRRYVLALDVGVKRDRTAAVIAHTEPYASFWEGARRVDQGRQLVLDRLRVWTPTLLQQTPFQEVEEFVLEGVYGYGARVVFDPWAALDLAQRLRAKGVRAEEFTMSSASVGRLAATLHSLIKNHALALPDDKELLEELARVKLRETSPGVVRMDHERGEHDDRAVALGIAAVSLLSEPESFGPRIVGRAVIRTGDRGGRRGFVFEPTPQPEPCPYPSEEQTRVWNHMQRRQLRRGGPLAGRR